MMLQSCKKLTGEKIIEMLCNWFAGIFLWFIAVERWVWSQQKGEYPGKTILIKFICFDISAKPESMNDL